MRKKIYVSASQIDNYRNCPRRWWFKSVKKIAESQTEAQLFGDRFAKAIEARLKGQMIPKFDELADTVIDRFLTSADSYFPTEADPNIHAERKIEFDIPDLPAKMVGYIDVLDLTGESAHIRDHKTRSDKRYAPTHEKLASDLQLNIYGYAIRLDLPQARLLEPTIGHINYIKPPKQFAKNIEYLREEWQPEVFVRQIPLDAKKNDAIMAETMPYIEGMVRYSDSLLTPESVPFDESGEACFSYGQPCAYSAICPKFNLTPRLIPRDASPEYSTNQSTRSDMSMKSLPPRPPQRPGTASAPPAPAAPAPPPPAPVAPTSASANLPPRPPSKLNMNGATFESSAPKPPTPPPAPAPAPQASQPPRPSNLPPRPPAPPSAKPPASLSMGAPNTSEVATISSDDDEDGGINPPSMAGLVPPSERTTTTASPAIPLAAIPNLSQRARIWLESKGFEDSIQVAHLTEPYLMGGKPTKALMGDLLKMALILRGLHKISEPTPFENCPELLGKPEKVASKAEMMSDLPDLPGTPPLSDMPAGSMPPKGFVPKSPYSLSAPADEPIMTDPSQHDPQFADPDEEYQEPITERIATLQSVNTPVTAADSEEPFYLYLECFPIKGANFVTLEQWLDPIFGEIEAEAGVTNWRSIVEFGRMNEMLHIAVREIIKGKTQYSLPRHLVVLSSYTEYAKAILDLLIRRATLVVKK